MARKDSNKWPYDMNNPASNRAYQSAQADKVNARLAADRADSNAHWDRITKAKEAEAKAMRNAKINNQRYGTPMPGAAASAFDWFDEKPAAKPTPKQSAIRKALQRFTGKGRPMGIPGGDLKNLRR